MHPFGGIPPEIVQEMQRQMELQQMSQEVNRHELIGFFDSLNMDQLIHIRSIFFSCEGAFASHLSGFVTAYLQIKHDVCAACGKKHGDASSLVPEAEQVVEEPTATEKQKINEDLMEEYGVRLPNDGELVFVKGLEYPVICTNCGILYQSLEDRLLRPPMVEGCHGCQIKSAHG